MSLPSDLIHQVFSLPVGERYELAQQLLDSIDEAAAERLNQEFISELHRRRDEMLLGQETASDWRNALLDIEASIRKE